MDPFSALWIASTVVQFVDFGTKILQKAKELRDSADGALAENIALGESLERFRGLRVVLQDSLNDSQQVSSPVALLSTSHTIRLHIMNVLLLSISKWIPYL